jgi:hypothetical protein
LLISAHRFCRSWRTGTFGRCQPSYLLTSNLHSSCAAHFSEPSTSTSSSKQDGRTSPPLGGSQQKQRIQLQPGPVKPGPTETARRSPFLPPPPARLTKRAVLPSAPTPPPYLSENLGTREMIRHDIQHAESNGVLKPTPPNASFFTSVTHKAIEITVRVPSNSCFTTAG